MFKDFFIKKALESQLKNLPADQKEQVLKTVSENPDLFVKIAKEIQQKIKEGMNQQQAAFTVLKNHQDTLRQLLQK